MTLIHEDPDEVPDHSVVVGLEKRAIARRLFGQAVYLTGFDDVEADRKMREALAVAASAMYWLADSTVEDDVHADLHRYGSYARANLGAGCYLDWTGSRYRTTCPVRIAHKRFGFSPAFTAERLCSICGEDVSECPHLQGRLYEIVGGASESGECLVCARLGCEEHLCGETYRVRANRIVVKADLIEISIVAKPKQPDARLTEIPVDMDGLLDALGPGFVPGMPVSCDYCQVECSGFTELEIE